MEQYTIIALGWQYTQSSQTNNICIQKRNCRNLSNFTILITKIMECFAFVASISIGHSVPVIALLWPIINNHFTWIFPLRETHSVQKVFPFCPFVHRHWFPGLYFSVVFADLPGVSGTRLFFIFILVNDTMHEARTEREARTRDKGQTQTISLPAVR